MAFIQSSVVSIPGNWRFHQSELGLDIEADTREEAAKQLATARRANPRFNLNADPKQCLLDIEEFNFKRLQRILPLASRADYFFNPPEDSKKNSNNSNSPNTHPMPSKPNALQRAARLARSGVKLLTDWVGEQPVDAALATSRASRCVNCDKNVKGDWLARSVAGAGEIIHDFLALKHQLNLNVPNEDQLGSCSACDCALRLKVWTPEPMIPIDDEMVADMRTAKAVTTGDPIDCWVLSEKNFPGVVKGDR
jgi:hypothetical protein